MIIIGEKLNATRPEAKAIIENRDEEALVDTAGKQIEAGARYIDVNVGTGMGTQQQEIDSMTWAVETLVNDRVFGAASFADLTAASLVGDPELTRFAEPVSDSGEGRWTVQAAVNLGVPAPVITSALFSRFASTTSSDFADRVLSAMRLRLGGHSQSEARQGRLS